MSEIHFSTLYYHAKKHLSTIWGDYAKVSNSISGSFFTKKYANWG